MLGLAILWLKPFSKMYGLYSLQYSSFNQIVIIKLFEEEYAYSSFDIKSKMRYFGGLISVHSWGDNVIISCDL